MLIITAVALFLMLSYSQSKGCPLRNLLASIACPILLSFVTSLSIPVAVLIALAAFVTLQIAMPLAAGQPRLWAWQAGRLRFAMAVV